MTMVRCEPWHGGVSTLPQVQRMNLFELLLVAFVPRRIDLSISEERRSPRREALPRSLFLAFYGVRSNLTRFKLLSRFTSSSKYKIFMVHEESVLQPSNHTLTSSFLPHCHNYPSHVS
jgi:hypothetical protein